LAVLQGIAVNVVSTLDSGAALRLIQETVQKSVDAGTFAAWLAPLGFDKIDLGTLYITSPSRFSADWVKRNFSTLILASASQFGVERLSISVGNIRAANDDNIVAKQAATYAPARPANAATFIGSKVLNKFTFENFIDSTSNGLAFAAVKRMAAEANVAYNPLLIHSKSGMGKTHMLQAFANLCAATGRRAIYTTADNFANSFVKSLQEKDVLRFKEDYKSADVLLVDDVHHFVGKESTARELFHIVDYYISAGKQVILSASDSPFRLDGLNDSLKSRISHGLVLDISAPDFDLRLKFVKVRAAAAGLDMSDEAASFLAQKITASLGELDGAVSRLAAHSVLLSETPTITSIKKSLGDILAFNTRMISILEIKRAVAERFGVSVADIDSDRRQATISTPRQVAMYLAKHLTPKSLPAIGKAFGRDHATVIHAIKKIRDKMSLDAAFAEVVGDLESKI